ncbi:MAG: hypothetical protein ACT4PS_03280 [Betaproteobacteria bacterium]
MQIETGRWDGTPAGERHIRDLAEPRDCALLQAAARAVREETWRLAARGDNAADTFLAFIDFLPKSLPDPERQR